MNLKFMFAVVGITGGSAFHHGFHAGLLNILFQVIQDWYANIQLDRNFLLRGFYQIAIIGPFILASLALGAIVGSLLIYTCSELFGRKKSLVVNNIIALIALLLHSLAYVIDSYELLIFARFLIGICAGLGSGITLMYLIEISPYCVRGAVGSFYYVMVAASIAFSHCFGLKDMLGQEGAWPYIFIFCIIPTILQVFMLLGCPESPKFLFINKENEDEAEEALLWFRGDDIYDELEDIREEDQILKDQNPVTLDRMLSDQILRSPLIISSVILIGQQICGIDAMLYFSAYIFVNLKYEVGQSIDLAIGLSVVNMLGAIMGMILMDKVGRKPLIMGSLGGMLVCLTCFAITILLSGFEKVPNHVVNIAVTFIYIYVLVYAVGVGTIPWFYAAELNNHFARPIAMSIGLTLNWCVNFVIVMSFMPLFSILGNFIFFIFSVFDLMVLVFITMTMRETMDMETVDIIELFYED